MNVSCSAKPCPVILDAACVFYSGGKLIYTGIKTNDNLQIALEKIDAKFKDASIGYIFSNGVIQASPGQPVKLGGSLVENTTINSDGFTFKLTGTIESQAFITTGGTASQFVKGDGSLDSTSYQPSGNYITSLVGDGTASGPGVANFTLSNSGVIANTYGSASQVPVITVDAKGRVTNVNNTPINYPPQLLFFSGDVGGAGQTGANVTLTLNNVNSNVFPAITPLKFAVNAKGLVTAAAPLTNLDIFALIGYTPVPQTRTLTINGQTYDLSANRSWTVSGLPSQTGNSGKFLTTNGTIASWQNLPPSGVTSVTATAPLASSGGSTPNISITQANSSTDGYLSSTDWTTFNNKQDTITLTTTGTSGAATFIANTLNIPQYQAALTNPVTGSGTLNYVPKWTPNGSQLGNSQIYDDGNYVKIGTGGGSMGFPYERLILERNGDTKFGTYTSSNSFSNVGASYVLGFTNITTSTGAYPGFEWQMLGSSNDSNNYIRYNFLRRNVSGVVTSAIMDLFDIYADGRVILNPTNAFSPITLRPQLLIGLSASSNVLDIQSTLSSRISSLGGSGTRMVVANSTGTLSTQSVPTGTVTSVGLSMPSAFTVTNSPVTSSGTLTVTGAGLSDQYIRGDGTLANFPANVGGGSSVSYYLNGSVNQGTFGGNVYYELSRTPIIGSGTNFTIGTNGYIAQFITDAGDPALLNIPGGNWDFQIYFSASSSGGSPQFYAELYKYDGTSFTLISSGSTSPQNISFGTFADVYSSTLTIPQTALTITDRLAVRIYVIHSGRTITLYTEDNKLAEVHTTFSTGLAALNGLTAQVQYLGTGTTGTDFNIVSATDTHTFNLPVASASNTGKLSSTDWSTFNNKPTVFYQNTAPTGTGTSSIVLESMWTHSDTGIQYTYIYDGNTYQWVQATLPLGPQGPQGASGTNTINASTATTFNGLLKGNGATISATTVLTEIGYTPEDVANKENTTLDTSATKYPTNNLVKTSLDAFSDDVDYAIMTNQRLLFNF